jgi:hypothetical protein
MPSEPLSMLDALRMAKETPGVKVRPCSWAGRGYVIWKDRCFQMRYDAGDLFTISSFSEESLLGPWEVVP